MTIISKYFQSAHCNPLRCADCETLRATIGDTIIYITDHLPPAPQGAFFTANRNYSL
jgi:hypothetical protein